ncbi:MAG: YggS family pyridoxal phosphate-dependent enzyme [Solirubrobacterales bacterium]|nr:YggS family pyridoxal phosphate-dependent enzyme [Solirubrobacterales bacterium]
MEGVDPARVAANLAEVREEIGPDVEILTAVKYVDVEGLGALVEGGVRVAGENRAQQLELKAAAFPELEWHFIGQLQSRKVKVVLPLVRWIHSVASDSALEQLGRHGTPRTEVLIEVNVAREEGKGGVAPGDLDAFIERCPVTVVGLMTMPPAAATPEDSRRWFSALRELAHARGLRELSMGTTQDYAVAAQEGATIVRVGTRIFR